MGDALGDKGALMTIALVIKVADGVVIAADSATTLAQQSVDGPAVVENIYNNANKVFNLHKGLPIGALTWGLGNIGPSSISSLSKDLRRRFQGGSPSHPSWKLDEDAYDIEAVTTLARDFLYGERYEAEHGSGPQIPALHLGYLIAGYSADQDEPSVFVLDLGDGASTPSPVFPAGETGAAWWGQPEAISRIMNGLSMDAVGALMNMGNDAGTSQAAAADLLAQLRRQLVSPAMPIQDAIDLAVFLVQATIQFVRFSPGSPMVGGPVDVATITKHEGFKWVQRKHFFDTRLNPKEETR
jgi:20S proteasome alpha/beta subunit